MKKLFVIAASSLLVMIFTLPPMAFAADAEQAFDKCKSEAEADEVGDADIKTYVSNCMKDLGVEADDIKALVDEEYSATETETAKSSSDD
jgi:Skp family chaperone for outer membrane proteins